METGSRIKRHNRHSGSIPFNVFWSFLKMHITRANSSDMFHLMGYLKRYILDINGHTWRGFARKFNQVARSRTLDCPMGNGQSMKRGILRWINVHFHLQKGAYVILQVPFSKWLVRSSETQTALIESHHFWTFDHYCITLRRWKSLGSMDSVDIEISAWNQRLW